MAGKQVLVSSYCRDLRMSLWRNHLGLRDIPEDNKLIDVKIHLDLKKNCILLILTYIF